MIETVMFSAKLASSVAALIAAGFYFSTLGAFELSTATIALIALAVGTVLVGWI